MGYGGFLPVRSRFAWLGAGRGFSLSTCGISDCCSSFSGVLSCSLYSYPVFRSMHIGAALIRIDFTSSLVRTYLDIHDSQPHVYNIVMRFARYRVHECGGRTLIAIT